VVGIQFRSFGKTQALTFAERKFEGLIAADAGIEFRAVDQATRVVQGHSASGVRRLCALALLQDLLEHAAVP